MCEKCKIYLHDYFQEPINKENPLSLFVNQKQVQKNLSDLVDLVYYLLFKTIPFVKFQDAKTQVENYCCFVIKPDNPYQQYEILYTFLSRDKKFVSEIKQIEGLILDCNFLRIEKTDIRYQVLHRWIAFLLGSLFEDIHLLHKQHSGEIELWKIDLTKGHPGRPDTGVKKSKKHTEKLIVVDIEDDDDLYT